AVPHGFETAIDTAAAFRTQVAFGMAALEARLQAQAAQDIQSAIERAATELFGAERARLCQLPKQRVVPSRQPHLGADLTCRAPAALWKVLEASAGEKGCVVVRSVSEYQLEREASYTNAEQLSRAIISHLEAQPTPSAAEIRTKADGSLQITTQLHMRRQQTMGRLHCATCGQ
ncbi:MAG: hypothetical protein SGPRY_007012, partial [Prymnesium sp.]